MGDKDENENDLSQSTDPGIQATQTYNTGLSIALIAYNIPWFAPYSPLSIASILANMRAGVGVHFKHLFTLHMLNISDSELFKGFSTTLKSIHNKSNETNFTLKIENCLFARKFLKLEKEFVDLLSEKFRTGLTPVDFTNTIEFVESVNTWATTSTNNLMGNILDPEKFIGQPLRQDLDLVWFSMVYFKGFWAQKFNPEESFNGPFLTDENEIMQVRYMQLTNHKFFVGRKEFKNMIIDIISIPFQGNRLRLVVYLPTDGSQLSQVITENRDCSIFCPKQLANILEEKSVNLSFPKFRQEFFWPPLLPLLFMGMPLHRQLDWSHIGTHQDGRGINKLFALEKVVVEFDEGLDGVGDFVTNTDNTEKKNADDVSAEILDFSVNRSFFYAIWDTFTNMIIIQGHCTNPRIFPIPH